MRWPWQKKPKRRDYNRDLKISTKRFFEAAASDRLLYGWDTYPASIDEVLRKDLRSLRARSREQARNNEHGKRFVSLLQSNIVGPNGIQIQAQTTSVAGELDTTTNQALEDAYHEWSCCCDVSGRLSRTDVERLFVAAMAYDGEFLALGHYGRGDHGFLLEVIDPERIDTDKDAEILGNGNRMRLGIEYAGAVPVAVWLLPLGIDGRYQRGQSVRHPIRDEQGRRRVFHEFLPEYPDQPRGIPWLSTALYRMKMLHGYDEAAITAARIGAAKAGFIKTDSGTGYTGDDETARGEWIMDVEPGSWEQLPADADVVAYNPDYPHEQYDSFTKRALMTMSAGLNVGYNPLAGDPEGVNYSTLRQFAIEDRDMFRSWQQLLIKFARAVRESWLPMAILAGKFDGRRTSASLRPARYQGRRWDWVDPQKEMAAHSQAIDKKITSVSQIIRDRGLDPDEVFAEIAAEREKMRSLGIADEKPPPR